MNRIQKNLFEKLTNIDSINIYNAIQYKLKKATFTGGLLANFDDPENRNANTGHANAKVYCIGFQYVLATPVKHRNNNSTNLSTTK